MVPVAFVAALATLAAVMAALVNPMAVSPRAETDLFSRMARRLCGHFNRKR